VIIFDTETTGLINHPSIPLDQQPEIIEIGALKLNDATLAEVGALSFLIKPKRLPLPPKIIEITGITDAQLATELAFPRKLLELTDFFLGERTMLAHNCPYDVGMMLLELRRLDRVHKFPWPPQQLCSVELNMDIKGHRMRLGDLYEHVTGQKPGVAHRALDDCRTTAVIARWMRTQGKL
jgi:DNA polymerase III epsilon subunit-like protein